MHRTTRPPASIFLLPEWRQRFSSALVAAVLFLHACAAPTAISPALARYSVVVLPANNRTGDELAISGSSFLEKYAWQSSRVTVSDVLTADASEYLAQNGFKVVLSEAPTEAPGDAQGAAQLVSSQHLADLALYLEIRRWEAEASFHPRFVIAAVDAALVEADSGRILWTASRLSRPVPTPGVISVGGAYDVAARAVISELLAPFAAQRR